MRSASRLSLSDQTYSKILWRTFVILHLIRRIATDELQTPVHDVLWHGCHLEPVSRTTARRVCLVLEGAGHQQRLFILPECMFCLFAAAVVVAVHRSRLTLWFLCFAANLFIYSSVSATLESPTTTAQWDCCCQIVAITSETCLHVWKFGVI